MEPLDQTTKQEYLAKLSLTGLFLAVFAGFVTQIARRPKEKQSVKLDTYDLALLSFSVLRLGRMVAYDRVAEPLRHPFARTVPDQTGAGDSTEPRPSENGVLRSIGQLICCPICAGTWISAILVYGLQLLPTPTRVFMTIMGATGMAEFLDSMIEAFSWTGQLARFWTGHQHKVKLIPSYKVDEREKPPGLRGD